MVRMRKKYSAAKVFFIDIKDIPHAYDPNTQESYEYTTPESSQLQPPQSSSIQGFIPTKDTLTGNLYAQFLLNTQFASLQVAPYFEKDATTAIPMIQKSGNKERHSLRNLYLNRFSSKKKLL